MELAFAEAHIAEESSDPKVMDISLRYLAILETANPGDSTAHELRSKILRQASYEDYYNRCCDELHKARDMEVYNNKSVIHILVADPDRIAEWTHKAEVVEALREVDDVDRMDIYGDLWGDRCDQIIGRGKRCQM